MAGLSKYARSAEATEYRRLYQSRTWRALRRDQLAIEPLCRMCVAVGRTTAATVCDHITPHRGDHGLFFDPSNLQSLCDADPYRCHSRVKQGEERDGFSRAIGLDGWPVDAKHPGNSGTLKRPR